MLTIEADMALDGQLTVLGIVRLEGRFDGTIVCTRLEIGSDGYLFGRAIAHELVVAGQIVGSVQARRIHLTGTAIVEGEVVHELLQMDETATLVGESRRHSGLAMPQSYAALETRARVDDADFRDLEMESRVRRAAEAATSRPQFEALRARFPLTSATAA
jgi:cytoskeletal protein CcmA (bactofilin family)